MSIIRNMSEVASVHQIGPAKPSLTSRGQRAAVIDVSVRQHDGIDVAAGDRQLAVRFVGDATWPLHHAAVEQHLLLADREKMFRAGDVAGCTEELELDRHLDFRCERSRFAS
jgi:hypothetical protein